MRYRKVVDETERTIAWDEEVIQTVDLDPDYDTIFGLRGVVEFGVLGLNDFPFEMELWTNWSQDHPHPFYKLYRIDVIDPGTYTMDFTTSTPAYPQLLRADWDQQTDRVQLRIDGHQQNTPVVKSEIEVLEF